MIKGILFQKPSHPLPNDVSLSLGKDWIKKLELLPIGQTAPIYEGARQVGMVRVAGEFLEVEITEPLGPDAKLDCNIVRPIN